MNFIAFKFIYIKLFIADEGLINLLDALDIFGSARAEGIKTEHTEDIPDSGCAVILVTREAVVFIGESFFAKLFNPVSRFFNATECGIDIRNVEAGLV